MKKTELIWGSEPRFPAWRAGFLSRGAVIGKISKTGKTSVLTYLCRIKQGCTSTWAPHWYGGLTCLQCQQQRHTVGQILPKCKETSNLMWLSLIWFILVLFFCQNLFCTIVNLKIKCVTETKNVSVLFCKNLKSSFSTLPAHLSLRFLYILGWSGPVFGGYVILRSL